MRKEQKEKFDLIAKEAFKTFGVKFQRNMLVEECSEVIMAIQKLKRAEYINSNASASEKTNNKQNLLSRKDNFIEEMVDVSIIIMQFYLCSTNEVKNRFDDIFESKMNRLDKRTKEHKKTLSLKNKSNKKKATAKKVPLKQKDKLPKTKYQKVTIKK